MHYIDREKEARVWQRVQGQKQEQSPRLAVKALLLTARENSARYAGLSRQFTGKAAGTMARLHRETEKTAASLQGICRIRGEIVKLPKISLPKEHHRLSLEKAYLGERQLWEEFENSTADPAHGPVFAALARQAKERSLILMELLGSTQEHIPESF